MKPMVSRRGFVTRSAAGLAAVATLPYRNAAATTQSAPVLIVMFLRGGADGLSMMNHRPSRSDDELGLHP